MRYSNKKSQWVTEKHFRTQGNRNWIFSAPIRPPEARRLRALNQSAVVANPADRAEKSTLLGA